MESVTITLGTKARIFETGQIMTDNDVHFLCRSINYLNNQIVKSREEEEDTKSLKARIEYLEEEMGEALSCMLIITDILEMNRKRLHELEEYVEDF